jgi:hypothetical protein
MGCVMKKRTAHSLSGVRCAMNATGTIGLTLSTIINSLKHIIEGKIEGERR